MTTTTELLPMIPAPRRARARRLYVGLSIALMTALPLASAQTTTSGQTETALNFSTWIGSLQNAAINVINQAGPALFALMAIIGGVYFVWNRVRSLW